MSFLPAVKIPLRPLSGGHPSGIQISKKLVDSARSDTALVMSGLATSSEGLTQSDVEARLEKYGLNEVAKEKRRTWLARLWDNIKNPLVILLTVLAVISYLTSDIRTTIMILLMVVLGIVLRYVQESRADNAAEKLKADRKSVV
jgi:P-type Mg2+ transporter